MQSSQALALDIFATLTTLGSRTQIVRAWAEDLALPDFGNADFAVETVLNPTLLGESRSTQVDAMIHGSAARALVECKFTEPDGGSCSQTKPIALPDGTKSPQCNGRYQNQRNPLTESTQRCALSAKGIKYWDFVPEVLRVSAETDHNPCPFAGGTYQWMRNMVAAHALERQEGLPHSFIIAYADGPFPMARKIKSGHWQTFADTSTGAVQLRTVSFQHLIELGMAVTTGSDAAVLGRLDEWVEDKVRRAAS